MHLWTFLWFSLWLFSAANAARILAVLPMPGKSHHRMFQGILKALSESGHHVTSYTPFMLDRPIENYTEIQIEQETRNDDERKVFDLKIVPYKDCYDLIFSVCERTYDMMLRSSHLQRLLKSSEKFDLVITEHVTGFEYLTMLGYKFNAPMIGVHAFMTNDVLNSLVGNSLSLSFLPDACTPHPNRMGFLERFTNTYYVLRRLYTYYYHYIPDLEKKMRRTFPEIPPLLDMSRNISLFFVNEHPTADYTFPRTSNLIPVGGIHIQPPERLPEDILKFMDESEEGVILFSLGTYVPDHLQPKEYFELYLGAFSKLRQRVLWKTRKTDFDNLPANVLTKSWMPQQGILNHPKCVLFVTHGGQNSQLETVHFGVPVVTIPQFFDQFRNAKFFEEKGVGLTLNEKDVTEESLLKAIQTVLGDKRYSHNMARLSAVFRDRPQSAAQSVVYWAEYVIRHAGAPHLRPVAATMPWYQRASVDVAAAFMVLTAAILVITYYCLGFILNHLQRATYMLKNKID